MSLNWKKCKEQNYSYKNGIDRIATDAQIKLLIRLGIFDKNAHYSKSEASRLISLMLNRPRK